MKSKLNVIFDTNVLLVSISSKSKYHWIFRMLLDGNYHASVSNEILMEYEEIISLKYNPRISKDVMPQSFGIIMSSPNVFIGDLLYF